MFVIQTTLIFIIFNFNLTFGKIVQNPKTIHENDVKSVAQVMKTFRCEEPDVLVLKHNLSVKERHKRFVLSGEKWVKSNESEPELVIEWKLDSKLNDSIRKAIEETANSWTQVINVKLVHNPADNELVLATFKVTQTPDPSGKRYDIKREKSGGFDFFVITIFDINHWTDQSLHNILLHIWGHVLGLSHSSDPFSIMYPFFADQTVRNLSADDIAAVQTLYGINPQNPNINYLNLSPNKADWSEKVVDLCVDSKIDSVLELPDGRWMFFKDHHYYEIGPVGQHLNSPRKIKWDYKEVDTPIDATLSWSKDIIFFFKGNDYWKYKNRTFVLSQKISDGFNGIPDGPFNDVFQWNVNQKTYFFKENQFWKYDSKAQKVATGYPKAISTVWSGIPDSFDAAISSRKRNQTYFFKNKVYYRFDDISKKVVDDQTPPYPRLTQIWFLKCRNTQNIPKWPVRQTLPSFPPQTTGHTTQTREPEVDDKDYHFWIVFLSIILGLEIIIVFGTGMYSIHLNYTTHRLENANQQQNDTNAPNASPDPTPRPPPVEETVPIASTSAVSAPRAQTSKAPEAGPAVKPKRQSKEETEREPKRELKTKSKTDSKTTPTEQSKRERREQREEPRREQKEEPKREKREEPKKEPKKESKEESKTAPKASKSLTEKTPPIAKKESTLSTTTSTESL